MSEGDEGEGVEVGREGSDIVAVDLAIELRPDVRDVVEALVGGDRVGEFGEGVLAFAAADEVSVLERLLGTSGGVDAAQYHRGFDACSDVVRELVCEVGDEGGGEGEADQVGLELAQEREENLFLAGSNGTEDVPLELLEEDEGAVVAVGLEDRGELASPERLAEVECQQADADAAGSVGGGLAISHAVGHVALCDVRLCSACAGARPISGVRRWSEAVLES
jgi:hypothetical protein